MRRIRRIASLGLHSTPTAMAPRTDGVAQGKPLIRDHKPNNKARQANEQRDSQHHSTAADELLSRTGVEIRPGFADGLDLSKSTVASALSPTPAQSIGEVHQFKTAAVADWLPTACSPLQTRGTPGELEFTDPLQSLSPSRWSAPDAAEMLCFWRCKRCRLIPGRSTAKVQMVEIGFFDVTIFGASREFKVHTL